MDTSVSFAWLFGAIGCLIGIAGFMRGRDTKVDREGQFKGEVNTKLDLVLKNGEENIRQHAQLFKELADHDTRITVLEKKRPPRRTNQDE